MTPFSSVAMLEKLALLRIAFCSAPVLSRASFRRTSVTFRAAALLWRERFAGGACVFPNSVIASFFLTLDKPSGRWSHHQTCPTRSPEGNSKDGTQPVCRRIGPLLVRD